MYDHGQLPVLGHADGGIARFLGHACILHPDEWVEEDLASLFKADAVLG